MGFCMVVSLYYLLLCDNLDLVCNIGNMVMVYVWINV